MCITNDPKCHFYFKIGDGKFCQHPDIRKRLLKQNDIYKKSG